ncbi:MAG: hypothetical protein H5T62_03815 [Anaerolineae bacterium]|nr:hypothetical protein [Anaerolineae bacterium]
MPFVLLSLALAFNLLRRQRPLDWAEYLLYAVCLGGLGFLNTWDFPIYWLVTVLAYAVNCYQRREQELRDWWREVVFCAVILLGLGLLLYTPFWVTFRSQAGGVLPNLFNVTRLHQYLLMFGMFVFVVGAFLIALVVELWKAGGLAGWKGGRLEGWKAGFSLWVGVAAAFPLLLLISIAPLVLTERGRQYVQGVLNSEPVRTAIGQQTLGSLLNKAVSLRLADPWLFLLLSGLIALVIFLVLRILNRSSDERRSSPANLFVLIMIGTGLLLTFVVEFVYLRDTFGTRMNTIFKFYYQAWVLLGLSSAYGAWYVLEGRRGWGRYVFALGGSLLLAASLVYTVTAGPSKAGGFKGRPTLDGLAYVREHEPDEYAAIRWLNAHSAGNPVIVEAVGGSFTNFARISSRTGLPTILGWSGHEYQWRGSGEEAARREKDVDEIYSSQDFQRTLDLLEEYDVTYVYVGPLERGKYSAASLEKFDTLLEVAFQQGEVTIYQRRKP